MQTSYSLSPMRSSCRCAQAKSPGFPIVGGPVRNPVRCFRQGEEVGSEFGERHLSVHRDAVVQHMQIASLKVHYAVARVILNVGIADIPFFRNSPVEHLSAGWNLAHFQGNVP